MSDPQPEAVASYFERLYRPGTAQLHAIVQASAHPADGRVAIAGPIYDAAGGFPVTRIAMVDAAGTCVVPPAADHNDSDPKWSPDGATLAFLSDRGRGGGNAQLFLADRGDLAGARPGPVLEGEVVESFAWDASGRRILIQSADAGADAAGSAATARIGSGDVAEQPSWMPAVETGSHDGQWRRARIWEVETGQLIAIGTADRNVWEASWLGDDAVVAIVSASPTEGGWYQTEIAIAPAAGGAFETFAAPEVELAGIAGSPDGHHIAVIEGRFHRSVQLGTLAIHDRTTGAVVRPAIGAEVSLLAWRDAGRLFFAGTALPETVVGTYALETATGRIEWRSAGSCGRKVPAAWPTADGGAIIPGHGFGRPPYLARIDADGTERLLFDLAHDGTRAIAADVGGGARAIRWQGRDGLEIMGWLAMPPGVDRPPLVAFIHGGPSHLFRDSWSFDNPLAALLVASGYAVLFPNPRGSSGRSADFAARVVGDMGGEDTHDILAGIDHVIAEHGVDGDRLFVTGGSYGGYMTSWLVTQSRRFRAAASLAPLTDMRSFFFTAHHPEFLALYAAGDPYEVGGMFDRRSPLRHADRVVTPTLLIAGGRDNTTPASQAGQFHRALALRGVPTELAIYPEEGHAAARYEAQIDQGIRVLDWFRRWGGVA